MNYAIFYNPNSCGGKGLLIAKEIEKLLGENSYTYYDILSPEPLNTVIARLPANTDIIITGGDGTLNGFVNKIDDFSRNYYFYASGSGNDFARDINFKKRTKPICINKYIKHLPTAVINGTVYKFLNCIGSGMDGYCCGEVERQRKISKWRGSYVIAAVKALLYAYRPCDVHFTADGKSYFYKNTWLIPTMNGRFFGGGFMVAPNQDRLNPESTLSLVAIHTKNIFKIIPAFFLIMKGKHLGLKSMVHVIKGHSFSIKLSKPATLEIDGETIRNVSEYSVYSAKLSENI